MRQLFFCGILGLAVVFFTFELEAQTYIPGTYPAQAQCPYAQTKTQGQGQTKLNQLKQQYEKLEARCEEAEDNLEDLEDLDSGRFNEDRLPLQEEARELLLAYEGNRSLSYCAKNGDSVQGAGRVMQIQQALVLSNICDMSQCNGMEDGANCTGMYSADICNSAGVYNNDSGRFNLARASKGCRDWIERVFDLRKRASKICDEAEEAEDDYLEESDRIEDRKWKAQLDGGSYEEEAPCYECLASSPEPRSPSTGQVVAAAATDIIGGYLTYRGYKYVSDQNAALGWDTSPIALGAYYPYATRNLYAAYAGGGQGAGSWGCSPTINGMNPNGNLWGNPYSSMSPYMNGGYGNPYMNGMNPFYSGLMPGASLGYGNPYMNGLNGGYGSPFGSGYGNPFGGGFGMSGGMGLYGQNPYMNGLGGGYGSPFGSGYGNPFGSGFGMSGGMGSQYQMQLMQMQMQQQQAYMQAQVRALQNQQVVSQQVYGLQLEYQQLMQRYQRLMMYSSSGGISGSIYLGTGSTGSTISTPGASITDPPTGR